MVQVRRGANRLGVRGALGRGEPLVAGGTETRWLTGRRELIVCERNRRPLCCSRSTQCGAECRP